MGLNDILKHMQEKQGFSDPSVRIVTKYNTDFTEKAMYSRFHVKDTACILGERPTSAPSIIEELNVSPENPLKIMMYQHQSPGDIIMLTAAIRDLHLAYPGYFLTGIDTTVQPLFKYNPYITELNRSDPDVLHMQCNYTNFIANSCSSNTHFIHAFHDEFERKLGVRIRLTKGKGDIYLSDEEKKWMSRIQEIMEADVPYWVVDAGRKSDFTSKLWAIDRFQAVVDAFPNVTFVQIGAANKDHYHPPLSGDNLINEVGKTDIRQLIRLMYHAAGVITPVSFPMHLAAAVEVHPKYKFRHRPCIVLAGAREPSSWEAYNTHSYLHNCGILPCSGNGGCWKARVERLGDGDKKDNDLCVKPVKLDTGQTIPKCMDLISAQQVIDLVQQYLDYTL
jgi:ADP-heptose:LPS heptosyltransferase